MKKLVFKNWFYVDCGEESKPMICELLLDDKCDYEPILEMYAGHYAGDRYYAYLNGEKLNLDRHGDLKPIIIDSKPKLKLIEGSKK